MCCVAFAGQALAAGQFVAGSESRCTLRAGTGRSEIGEMAAWSTRFGEGVPEAKPESPALRDAVVSLGLIGTGFALDRSFSRRFAQGDDFMPDVLVAEPGEVLGDARFLAAGTAALGSVGILFHKPALTRAAGEVTLSLAAATAGASLIKVVSDRTRPNGNNDFSFPSGHTTGAFAVATVLDREFGGWVGPIAYGAAASVGFSRMADRHHYFSDVVAGAILGHFIGKWVTHKSAARRREE